MVSPTSGVKYFDQTSNLKVFTNFLYHHEPLTRDEEINAFKEYRNGNRNGLVKIVEHNQRFVYSMAKEYARDESEVMDYVNEGNLGLIEAIETFDIEKGLKFISYAVWYIRRSMNAYLMNKRDMMVKSNNTKIGKKQERICNKFYLENGRTPTIDEIKEVLKNEYDIDVKDDSDLYDVNMQTMTVSEDSDEADEDCNEISYITATHNEYCDVIEKDDASSKLEIALRCLPDKQKEIIKKLYGVGYTNYSPGLVCQEYNLTEEGLAELENSILEYVRENNKVAA